jgi:dTMP kinase
MRKALFLVFEGIDGSGKGTQSKMLSKWLMEKGYDVFLTSEPTDGKIGKIIRESLKKDGLDPVIESLLFAADRKQHTIEISAELKRNRLVICDRYFYSSIAYQGAHGIDLKWIKTINKFALKPDFHLILDVKPEIALERVNSRGGKTDYFEKLELLKRVREIYLNQDDALVVDASRSVEEVQREIRAVVLRFLR